MVRLLESSRLVRGNQGSEGRGHGEAGTVGRFAKTPFLACCCCMLVCHLGDVRCQTTSLVTQTPKFYACSNCVSHSQASKSIGAWATSMPLRAARARLHLTILLLPRFVLDNESTNTFALALVP